LNGALLQNIDATPLKTVRCRQYSFKQLGQFTVLYKLLDPALETLMTPLQELPGISLSLVRDSLEMLCSSPMKTLRGKQHSFTQLTQFTMLKKVAAPFVSHMNDSLTSSTVLLPIPLRGLFCT
jgi:hypothetical protein